MDATEKTAAEAISPAIQTRRQTLAVCLGLIALVWAVFGQSIYFDFVSYDDPGYVYQNPAITQGLSLSSVAWVFTHSDVGAWFPITDISHQFLWQLFGPQAGAHHFANVLLHSATVVCLFLALHRLTRKFWSSAIVAAIFAVHPLRVESVAWVVERKDVLSGLFFALTLWAWAGHAQKLATSNSPDQPRSLRLTSGYWLTLVFFVLGLLSKSMLVTLPCVLLLLDYWPLNRLNDLSRRPLRTCLCLIVEKIPFLLLSVVDAVITMTTQKTAVTVAQASSLPSRLSNALLAYTDYLGHMLYPVGLTVVYTHPPAHPPLWQIACSACVLLAITGLALVWHRKHPWLMVGWFWYLGMMLPVIDIMQAGQSTRADRFTYLPHIGICLLLVWGASELFAASRQRRTVLTASAITVILGLSVAGYIQTTYWKNSVTLWTHALNCKCDQAFVHNSLGSTLFNLGNSPEAIAHFEKSIALDPQNPEAHVNLGVAFAVQENRPAAVEQFEYALRLNPYSSAAHYNLGDTLSVQGKTDEAIQHFRRALELNPDLASAHYALGFALATQDQWDEAIPHYEQALRFKIDRTDAQYITAVALGTQHKWPAAITLYRQVLAVRPDYAEAHNNLGQALANNGQTEAARTEFQQALAFAKAQGNATLAESIRVRLESFPSNSVPKQTP